MFAPGENTPGRRGAVVGRPSGAEELSLSASYKMFNIKKLYIKNNIFHCWFGGQSWPVASERHTFWGALIFYVFFMLFNACGINDSKRDCLGFPPIVTLKNLQEEYKIACFAMYSVNSCCECNCLAQNVSTSDHNNTNILELDLKLASLAEKKDTIIFYFNFYKINNNRDTLFYQMYSNDYASCMYNGIAVIGKDKRYFPTTLGGHDAIIIDKDFIKNTQRKFNKCLALDNIKVSETLKKTINIENQ